MNLINIITKIGLNFNFGPLTSALKIFSSYLRFYLAILKNKKRQKQKNIIFICALPKSGSTWLENLLSINHKYINIMPPEVILWEQKYGRSDNFIPSNLFLKNIPNGNWIIKIHAKFSKELANKVFEMNLKPIILTRQINSILDSHIHYVLKTRFHPDYMKIKDLTKDEKLLFVKNKYYKDYLQWELDWKKFKKQSLFITYENLLNNTKSQFLKMLAFLEIKLSNIEIDKIISDNSIEKMRKRSVHKHFFRGSEIKNNNK